MSESLKVKSLKVEFLNADLHTLSPSKSHVNLLMELLMKAICQFSVLREKLFWLEVIQTVRLLKKKVAQKKKDAQKKKEKREKKKEGCGLAGLSREG